MSDIDIPPDLRSCAAGHNLALAVACLLNPDAGYLFPEFVATICDNLQSETPCEGEQWEKLESLHSSPVSGAGFHAGSYTELAFRLADRVYSRLLQIESGHEAVLRWILKQPRAYRNLDSSEIMRNHPSGDAFAELRDFDFLYLAACIEKEIRALEKFAPATAVEPPAPLPPQPVVELRGMTHKPMVCGNEVEAISEPYYRVVEALLAAGTDGLGKKDLEQVNGDAIKYLRSLRNSGDWKDAIKMAGKAWGRYAIVHK